MPKRSKLDPYRDQIAEWVRQGKTLRQIADLLAERKIEMSHQAVGNYIHNTMGLELAKVAKLAEKIEIKSAEQAAEYITKALDFLEGKDTLKMGEKALMSEKGAWVDRLARYMGWTQNGTKVAVGVQVNLSTLDILNKWLDES